MFRFSWSVGGVCVPGPTSLFERSRRDRSSLHGDGAGQNPKRISERRDGGESQGGCRHGDHGAKHLSRFQAGDTVKDFKALTQMAQVSFRILLRLALYIYMYIVHTITDIPLPFAHPHPGRGGPPPPDHHHTLSCVYGLCIYILQLISSGAVF